MHCNSIPSLKLAKIAGYGSWPNSNASTERIMLVESSTDAAPFHLLYRAGRCRVATAAAAYGTGPGRPCQLCALNARSHRTADRNDIMIRLRIRFSCSWSRKLQNISRTELGFLSADCKTMHSTGLLYIANSAAVERFQRSTVDNRMMLAYCSWIK